MSTATAFFVHGIKHTIFKNSGNASASIYVGRALKDFSNDNMEIKAAGYFDSIEEFEKVLSVNIKGVYFVLKEIIPIFCAS